MGYLRLFLYAAILVISIINLIVFYVKKSKVKNTTKKYVTSLQSHRSLTPEETEAINKLYKCTIASGLPVYTILGNYEKAEITVNNTTSDVIHTMNGILIQPCTGIETLLKNAKEIEVTDLENKKGAIIVSVDKKFTITSEFEREKALEQGSSYISETPEGNSFSIQKGYEIREDEYRYIKNDARIFINLSIFTLLIVSFFVSNFYVDIALVVASVFIFIQFYLPKTIRVLNNSKADTTTVLSGTLKVEDKYYFMDRYSLIFPKQYKSRLKNGDNITVSGKFGKRNKTEFKVLTLNNQSIISAKEKKDRFILTASIGVAIVAFILFPIGNIVNKIQHTFEYWNTKNLQVVYSNYDDLKSASLQKGQYVELKKLTAVPSDTDTYYNNEVYISNDIIKPDFSPLFAYLEKLRQVQETKEFLDIVELTIDNEVDWYYFETTFHQNENINSILEYEQFFPDSTLLKIIIEASTVLDGITNTDTSETSIRYPASGALEKYLKAQYNYSNTLGFFVNMIETIYNDFLYEQVEYIQKMHTNIRSNTYKNRDQIIFYCDKTEPFIGNVSQNTFYLNYQSVALFGESKSYLNPIIKYDTLGAESTLLEYVKNLDSSFIVIDEIKGIVKDFKLQDTGNLTEVSFNLDSNYSDIPNTLKDILIFVLFLLFISYAGIKLILLLKKDTNSENLFDLQ